MIMTGKSWIASVMAQLMLDRSRWFLFSPVFVGAGIVTYFQLPWHPEHIWLILPLGPLIFYFLARKTERFLLQLAMTILFLFCLGFSASVLRAYIVAAPVLEKKMTIQIEGTVAEKSSGVKTARLILKDMTFTDRDPMPKFKAIRLSVRSGGEGVHPGMRIQVRAVLLPPPPPVYAGGFDFQRHAYFQSIGATGYAIGPIDILGKEEAIWPLLKGQSAAARSGIANYVLKWAPAETAGFTIAILTGDKGAIPAQQLEDMRHSGLAHLLAISGLHMGMIGGLIFFLSRFLLACWPPVALNLPIKKIAALTALLGLVCYLFVSGMSVSALRAFIMISAFFIAICFDRTALSFRMVVLAALIIMLLFPESLLSASFQMSFAAVFALISLYEKLGPALGRLARSGTMVRRAGIYMVGTALTSLVAGLATAPFAVYHFGQMATFSLAANVIAVPIMGFWVMPWAIATFLTIFIPWSFPLDMMGIGIQAILKTAQETASWPNAVQFFGAYPAALLIGFVLASLWWMIWRQPVRWAALPFFMIVIAVSADQERPIAIISNSGNLFAVSDGQGRAYLSSRSIDKFSSQKWPLILGAIDQGRSSDRMSCDPYGCLFRQGNIIIAFPENRQGVLVDCQRATVIMSRVPIYGECPVPARTIDKFDLWRDGSHSLYGEEDGNFRIESVNGVRGRRPWVPQRSGS